jgi:cytochrome c oxidase subunit 2
LKVDGRRSGRVQKLSLTLALLVAVFAGACGDAGPDELSTLAGEGAEVARSNGCTACHGNDGEGSVGPAWIGLAGSEVELADGSTTDADTEYLRRSITDPQADLVAGYDIQMPGNNLTSEQVDAVVAYIEELR